MNWAGMLYAAAIWVAAAGAVYGQDGPSPPRANRHPLLSIFPDPLPDGRAAIAMEAASQFLRPDFENSGDGRTFARFDGEDWGLAIDLPHKLGPIVLNLRLRGVWRSGGWADQAFASWHSVLGVPQGGRDAAPKYRLDYSLVRDGNTVAQLVTDRACFMDADLAVLYPFGGPKSGGRLGMSIQAPTGSRNDFSGSGGWDELIGIAIWQGWGRFLVHSQLECAFLGIADSNPYSGVIDRKAQKRAWAGVGYAGAGRGFWNGLGLDITIGYAESPFSVGIPRIDRPGWQQHWTFSHSRLPNWRAGISEEAGTYTSPDLTAFFLYRF